MAFFLLIMLVIAFEVSSSVGEFNCKDVKKHKNFHLLPTTNQCGMIASSSRILGGKNADLGEFPWMAILFFNYKDGEKAANCGGAVISDRYILTAAHCVTVSKRDRDYDLSVVLGEHDTSTTQDCVEGLCAPTPVELGVARIITKQKHSSHRSHRDEDIALLRVTDRIQYNKFISPVCLPTSCSLADEKFIGQPLVVAGWGNTYDEPGRKLTSVLQKLTVTGVDMQKCQSAWAPQPISPRRLCAGGSTVGQDNKDSCQGDSGGPLIFLDDLDGPPIHYVIVGVVGEGQSCEQKTYVRAPGLYTSVGAFLQWILDSIEE